MDSEFLTTVMMLIVIIVAGQVVAFFIVDAVHSHRTIRTLRRRINDLERFNLRLIQMEGQLKTANQQLDFIVRSIMEHTNPAEGETDNGQNLV